ncbi:MAG: hydrogenase maturation protease [Thermoleophilia bacterium]
MTGLNEVDGGGAEGAAPSVTILGVGNTLMGDDGLGIFVVEDMDAQSLGPGVNVIVGNTAGMALLKHFLESDVVIVIDAIDAGADAGSIFRFNPDEAGIMNLRSNNIHGMGVPYLVTNARLMGANPEVIVFAVQVANVMPDDRHLSPPVEAAVERVRQLVTEEVRGLIA